MYFSNWDMKGALRAFAVVCGVVGWVVIESLIWLFSHVSIGWAW